MRVEGNNVYAWGIPFSGSSLVRKNVKLPLAAIVYLEQSLHNEILRLHGAKAFRNIWEGCSLQIWNTEDVQKCSETVVNVISAVPVYSLKCRPDEEAVEVLQQQLEREGIYE